MKFSKQSGAIGTGAIIALAVVGLLVAGIVSAILVGIGAYNAGNTFEQGIKATHKNNQIVLSTHATKVVEAAQVTDMQRDDLVAVAKAAISGRYGEDGSKAMFQAITESNPQVDPSLYKTLQEVIVAGRDEFKVAQQRLTDQKRAYEESLGSFPRGFVMKLVGYPKINLDEYGVVISESTQKAFETGRDTPIQLRRPAPAAQ